MKPLLETNTAEFGIQFGDQVSFAKIRAVARDACSPYYKRAPDVAIPSRL